MGNRHLLYKITVEHHITIFFRFIFNQALNLDVRTEFKKKCVCDELLNNSVFLPDFWGRISSKAVFLFFLSLFDNACSHSPVQMKKI